MQWTNERDLRHDQNIKVMKAQELIFRSASSVVEAITEEQAIAQLMERSVGIVVSRTISQECASRRRVYTRYTTSPMSSTRIVPGPSTSATKVKAPIINRRQRNGRLDYSSKR